MPIRFVLASLAAVVLSSSLCSVARAAEGSEAAAAKQGALVVLIGEAAQSEELRGVLSELLEREGVAVEYQEKTEFSPSALLSESRDGRAWVFVTEPRPNVAKLYFRGPGGRRFLLRRLALKNGLDELGRELIGQVVQTSAVALLRSDAGLSRKELWAGLSADDDVSAAAESAAPTEAPADASDAGLATSTSSRRRTEYELSARGFSEWTGKDLGFDHGVGAEMALAFRLGPALFVRGLAVFEYGFGQSLETSGLDADVHTTSFRAGADVGTHAGSSAFSLGLLAGADFTKTSPKATGDRSLALASASSGTVPIVRIEARYELALGVFRASAGIFGDVSLADTHYDVQDASGSHRVSAPWPVRPGLALTLGMGTGL